MSASKRKFNFDDNPPPKREPPKPRQPIPTQPTLAVRSPYDPEAQNRIMEAIKQNASRPILFNRVPDSVDAFADALKRMANGASPIVEGVERQRQADPANTGSARNYTFPDSSPLPPAAQIRAPVGGNDGQVLAIVYERSRKFGPEFLFGTGPQHGDYIRFKYDAASAKWIEIDRNRGVQRGPFG